MTMISSNCSKYPCSLTAAGCTDPLCPSKSYPPMQPYVQPFGLPATPQGCICPPTSEKTCENPTCPRKNPFKHGERHMSQAVGLLYEDALRDAQLEIKRLRSLLNGIEIALARDGDIDGAMKLILAENPSPKG